VCSPPNTPLLIVHAGTRCRPIAAKRLRELGLAWLPFCDSSHRCVRARANTSHAVRYARQLEKKGRLKLVYVMMQEECVGVAAVASKRFDLQTDPVFIRYTTVSQPECVDGWLGMQLSDKLWFPCWNSKVMSDSAARIIPLISSLERTTAALQPASPAPSFNVSQALPASPRNTATPTALSFDGSAGKHTPSFATAHSGAAAVDPVPADNVVASLLSRLGELQVENRTLAARSAAMDGSRRSADPSAAVADVDAGRLYSVVEALLASNRAMQDSHQSSLQTLQQSLISNQRLLQEALAASQRQVASVQTHNFALIVAAGCLGAALLAVVVVRGRI
jgi:hypothetical protein